MRNSNSNNHTLLIKIILITAGFIGGVIVISIFFTRMTIRGDSMSPSLNKGESVIISTQSDITKGDILAIKSPVENDKIIILRTVAMPNETIEIRNKIIFINGKKFTPPWKIKMNRNDIFPMKFCYRDNMPPVKLNKEEYFLIGDNFDRSFDSRNFGKVGKELILGKIIYKSGS